MNLLKDWLESLIKKPINLLDDLYSDEDSATKELDFLPLPKTNGHPVQSSHVSDVVLQQLHDKIRGHSCEGAVWNAVLWYLAHPLPVSIAHDLIDRATSTAMMGLTRQVDEVQWRLATFDGDALYTLVRERYVNSQYSVVQFEIMLEQYSHTIHNDGILYMLSFYETPSPEKKAILIAAFVREKKNKNLSKYIKKRLKEFLREQSQ